MFFISLFLWLSALIGMYNRQYSISVFNLIWGVLLNIIRTDLVRDVSSKTIGIILLTILFVNIGYFIGKLSFVFNSKENKLQFHNEKEKFNSTLVFRMMIVSGVILFYYAIQTLMTLGFDLALIRGANEVTNEESVFSNLLDTILFYGIARTFVYVAALSIAYNFSQSIRTPKKIFVLFAFNILFYVLISGGRTLIVRVFLFFTAAILWRIHPRKGLQKIRLRYVIFVGLLIFIVLNVITSLRNIDRISFLEQTVAYWRAAPVHMDYQLERMEQEHFYYGYVVYGGFFYYPVKIINYLFGTSLQTSNDIMFFLQKYKLLRVGNQTVYYNSLLPSAFYYYYDSGYAGVIIFSMILGITARKSECSYNKPNFFIFALWGTSLYAFCYSPTGGVLWNFGYATALAYAFLLRNVIYKIPSDVRRKGT